MLFGKASPYFSIKEMISMALFGRRKPGFSKEVTLKPEDISDEFSDRNDPAMMRNSNPKAEKAEMAARAQAVMDGTAKPAREESDVASIPEDLAQAAAARGETVDLFDYLDSLPDVEDPFPPSEPEPESAPEPEHKPAEMLADYIRERTKAASLTGRKKLAEEEPHLDEMLEELHGLESCKDICTVKGNKDEYFYSDEYMAHNYARIAMLVLEKDLPLTIAEMVRFNSKTYPSPTPLSYFERHPYYYTKPQLQHALTVLARTPDYSDVKTLVTENNHVTYLYSERHMSFKYARALAEGVESGEADG